MLQLSEISAAVFAGRRMFSSVATSFPAFKFRDSFFHGGGASIMRGVRKRRRNLCLVTSAYGG
jgi:hypothetical protein